MTRVLCLLCSTLAVITLLPSAEAQFQPSSNRPPRPPRPGRPDFRPRTPSHPNGAATRGLCKDGWDHGTISDFSGNIVPICIKVNPTAQSWADARATCRRDSGFLMKLDSAAGVGGVDLMSAVLNQGITKFWTGIHTAYERLAWDDLIPNQVRPVNNNTITGRPWRWSDGDLGHMSQYCGSLTFDGDDDDSTIKRRKKRAPDEHSDQYPDSIASRFGRQFESMNTGEGNYPPTGAFRTILTRTQMSDQLAELPDATLGIQSERQIPGSGHSETNIQGGGLMATASPMFESATSVADTESDSNSKSEGPSSTADLISSMKEQAEKLHSTDHVASQSQTHTDMLDKWRDQFTENTNVEPAETHATDTHSKDQDFLSALHELYDAEQTQTPTTQSQSSDSLPDQQSKFPTTQRNTDSNSNAYLDMVKSIQSRLSNIQPTNSPPSSLFSNTQPTQSTILNPFSGTFNGQRILNVNSENGGVFNPSLISSNPSDTADTISDTVDKIKDALKDSSSTASDAINNFDDTVQNINSAESDIADAVSDKWEPTSVDNQPSLSDIADTIKDTVHNIVDDINETPDITSDSISVSDTIDTIKDTINENRFVNSKTMDADVPSSFDLMDSVKDTVSNIRSNISPENINENTNDEFWANLSPIEDHFADTTTDTDNTGVDVPSIHEVISEVRENIKDTIESAADKFETPDDLTKTFQDYMSETKTPFPTPADVSQSILDASSSNSEGDSSDGQDAHGHSAIPVEHVKQILSETGADSSSLEHGEGHELPDIISEVIDDMPDTVNESPLADKHDDSWDMAIDRPVDAAQSDTLDTINDDSPSEKVSDLLSQFTPASESSDVAETLTDYLKHMSDGAENNGDDGSNTDVLQEGSDDTTDHALDGTDAIDTLRAGMETSDDNADNTESIISEKISDMSETESNAGVETGESDDLDSENVLPNIDTDVVDREVNPDVDPDDLEPNSDVGETVTDILADGDIEGHEHTGIDDLDVIDGAHVITHDVESSLDDTTDKMDDNLPFGVKLPDEPEGDTLDDHVDDHLDDVPDLAEALTPDDKVTALGVKSKLMDLSSCHAQLPSVCFSYQIEVMNTASTCDNGWNGHVLVDRCYRILDGKQSYQRSVAQCRLLGAELVQAQTRFERKFILVAVQKDGKFFRGTKFWMLSGSATSPCRFFDEKEVTVAQTCNRAVNAVCVKPAKPTGIYTTDNRPITRAGNDVPTETRVFSVKDGNNRLPCRLTSSAPELPTLWYRDGTLIETKDRFLSPDTSLTINEGLVTAVRTVTGRDVSLAALQGTFWCEVWDRTSMSTKRDTAYEVRFSDVMSFHGSLALQEFDRRDEVLFNMMGRNFDTLTRTEADLKTIFNDALPVLRGITPFLTDVFTFVDRVRSTPSVVEYHTHLTLDRNYTTAEEAATFSRLKGLLRAALRNHEYMASLPGDTPVSIFRTMSLQSTVSCPEAELQTTLGVDGHTVPSLTFTFPWARLGEYANSNETCGAGLVHPAGVARCIGGLETGAYWGGVRAQDCGAHTVVEVDYTNNQVWGTSPFTDKLTEMAQMAVDSTNVESVMTEVAQITEVAVKLTPTDITKIADVLEHTTQIGNLSRKVGEDMVKTVDRLMASSEKEVHVANTETHAANRIIKSLERFADHAAMANDDSMRVVSDNVVVEIWTLNPDSQPVIGLAARSDVQRPEKPFRTEDIATIFNRSQLFQSNVDAAIELPAEIFNMDINGQKAGNRLTMMVFRKSKLFEAAAQTSDTAIGAKDEKISRLNSYVISASLAGRKLTGLKEKVKTIFRPLTINEKHRQCVFWDFALNSGRGGWSTEGCYYEGRTDGRDVCLCDHLTNFAVLLDFYGESDPIADHHELSLSIITVVGLSLSILGLSLTIITFAFFRKLRKGRAQQTLFNLAVALLCSMLLFLVGSKQTHSYWACLTVAALLHYFILAAFMWMLMEAVLQYLTFVKILGTYITRFTLKTMLPAWGLPLLPVIAVLSVDYKLYRGRTDYCWIDQQAFYYAFLVPVSCIIVTNIAIFFITIVSIFRRGKGLRSNQKRHKMAMTNLQAALTSFILLGLTWVFGYLAVADARLPLQYIFTILSSMQGFFIFALFVVRKKKVREQWYFVCCKGMEKDRVSRSLSATNSTPSTYSNGSNRNSRHDRDRSDSTKTVVSNVSSKLSSRFSNGYTNHGYNSDYDLPYNRRLPRHF